jgi:hypothetical protein
MKNRTFAQAATAAASLFFIVLAVAGPKEFWEAKPYTEWTIKEVEKLLLKDSPWTHVLLLNAPSSSVSIGSTGGGGGSKGGSGGGAEGPPPIYINWYAKPIREAIVRQMVLMGANTKKEDLDAILNHKSQYHELILTGMSPGGAARGNRGGGGNAESALAKFKEDTFLQTKSGAKIPLANLVPPRSRNGASTLQFAKEIDGKPTLSPEDKEVTLSIRVNESVYKYKFKLADMMIGGKLEL